MLRCGLLGRKLGHSYSPEIHACLGDYEYKLWEKEPDALEDFLKNGSFDGLNVTIPYKKAVIPYCAELSPVARRLGAVNTIVRPPDGSLIGHNTDYHGFFCLLRRSGLEISGKKCLVLGSGGASVTVVAVLEEAGANVVVISRGGENNYDNLHLHADAALIVNATPVGMYPNTEEAPLSLEGFPKLEGVLDLIYNPIRTKLIMAAEERGIVALGGLRMLVEQARESSEWFTGTRLSDGAVSKAWENVHMRRTNIVLVGMPGCGKSTIARCLNRLGIGKEVVDADRRIADLAGMSIPEIFAKSGEAGFRKLETAALAQIGKGSGQIIATGGGCVTRPENYGLLHQNSVIFWIRRDLSKLPTDGRPLSQTTALTDMYRVREPMYRAFADFTVSNNGSVEAAAEAIKRQFLAWCREEYAT